MSLFNELLTAAVSRPSPRVMARWLDQVHSGDSFELMQKLPVGSVDTIIARPPARKDQPYNEYVEWQRDCLRAMMRVLRDDGAIFYAYNWQIQNGLVKDPTDILARFPVRNIIVWRYKARARIPGPNHTAVYLIARSDFEPVSESWDDIWTDLDSTGFALSPSILTTLFWSLKSLWGRR